MRVTKKELMGKKGAIITTFNDQLRRSNAYLKSGSEFNGLSNNLSFIKVNCLHELRQPSTVKLLEVIESNKDQSSVLINRTEPNKIPNQVIFTRKFLDAFENKEFYDRLPENDKKNIKRTMKELKKTTNSSQFDQIFLIEFPILFESSKITKNIK